MFGGDSLSSGSMVSPCPALSVRTAADAGWHQDCHERALVWYSEQQVCVVVTR